MNTAVLALQSLNEVRDDFQAHWPVFVSMPITAAAIGYLTKLLAIEMLFRPPSDGRDSCHAAPARSRRSRSRP